MMNLDKEKLGEKVENFASNAKKLTGNISGKTKEIVTKSKDKVVTAIDANGDGQIDIEDIIIMGLKTPGIGIDRTEFIKKEFSRKHYY